MKITVIQSDRQRRLFEVEADTTVSHLVRLVHAIDPMDDKALFFQGKQLDEGDTMLRLSGIPIEGGVVRVDDAEEPVPSRTVEVEHLDEEDEESEMQRMLGFGSFSTSKGTVHANISGAKIVKKAKHRQYMNRKGGKEKPLASDT